MRQDKKPNVFSEVRLVNGEVVKINLDSVGFREQVFARMGSRLIAGIVTDHAGWQGVYIWREYQGIYRYLGDIVFIDQEDIADTVRWHAYPMMRGIKKQAAEFHKEQVEEHRIIRSIREDNRFKFLSSVLGKKEQSPMRLLPVSRMMTFEIEEADLPIMSCGKCDADINEERRYALFGLFYPKRPRDEVASSMRAALDKGDRDAFNNAMLGGKEKKQFTTVWPEKCRRVCPHCGIIQEEVASLIFVSEEAAKQHADEYMERQYIPITHQVPG